MKSSFMIEILSYGWLKLLNSRNNKYFPSIIRGWYKVMPAYLYIGILNYIIYWDKRHFIWKIQQRLKQLGFRLT